MTVMNGIDVLQAADFAALQGQRIGLMTNLSATTRDLIPTVDVLWRVDAVHLAALYGPEHGITGDAPDGVKLATMTDPRTGLPAYSLYGEMLRPTRDMLAGIDRMLVDIPDVGARFYTFLWTITHLLEACGEYGVPVTLLDRPNPSGATVAGPPLDEATQSTFVGRYDIPVQHGMTLGEIAQMLNAERNPHPADLTIIPCANYTRSMTWEQTGLPFVPPSPNMPTLTAVRHYPGACLVEGTTLSEGRGTALPFQIVGAPGIDGFALAAHLNGLGLSGVRFRPITFRPTASKYAGDVCGGVQAHITDQGTYRPIETWLTVIQHIAQRDPDVFGWKTAHFDRLAGSAAIREAIADGASVDEIAAGWADTLTAFQQRRAPYLLYDRFVGGQTTC